MIGHQRADERIYDSYCARPRPAERGANAMTSGKAQINLQDGFLNQVRKESSMVTVFLVNGCKLRGIVRGFDNFTIVLESDGKQHLVYKHAVSTISLASPCDHVRAPHCERSPQGGDAPTTAGGES